MKTFQCELSIQTKLEIVTLKKVYTIQYISMLENDNILLISLQEGVTSHKCDNANSDLGKGKIQLQDTSFLMKYHLCI